MSKEPEWQRLRELSWRGKLSDAEQADLQAALAAHPELETDLEVETGLTDALARLQDVLLPSNFTARVLAQVQREDARKSRRPGRGESFWLRIARVFPKVAVAAVIIGTGLFSYSFIQGERRAELAHSVAAVSAVPSAPNPEILQDFEAIRALNQGPPADEQLLVLLQ